MNVIRTIMNAIPEKQKEVLQTLLSLVVSPGKGKGCRRYGIYTDVEDSNVFSLISEWETRQHLDQYVRSDGFSVLLGIKSLLIEPMEIQILTILDAEGMDAVNAVRKKN
ncbi:MAG: antibiotic biosynthesis monooxygenase [Desulfobacteraceae bacterium]|nr:MAG: antibiotic biosynthesis monooxygenase [Desulfobacteraceae bacterium]